MLKLVIVVLTGIGLSTEKDDVIFALSMATSFGALIYFGLQESIQIRDASHTYMSLGILKTCRKEEELKVQIMSDPWLYPWLALFELNN